MFYSHLTFCMFDPRNTHASAFHFWSSIRFPCCIYMSVWIKICSLQNAVFDWQKKITFNFFKLLLSPTVLLKFIHISHIHRKRRQNDIPCSGLTSVDSSAPHSCLFTPPIPQWDGRQNQKSKSKKILDWSKDRIRGRTKAMHASKGILSPLPKGREGFSCSRTARFHHK